MKIQLKLFIFLMVFTYVSAEYVYYKNYRVYNVVPQTVNEVELLKKIRDKNEFMFWLDVGRIGQDVMIMVAPEKQEKFEKSIASSGLIAVLFIDDVQRLIDEQLQPKVDRNAGKYNWTYYQTLEEVYDWMDEIASEYSNIVTIEDIGRSVENRPIKGIKIDYKKKENPVIGMFEGTLHAREWISTVTLTWIIKEFLTSQDEQIRFLAENVVWHVFPVTNPDGYKFTFTNNRMWRKNRSQANIISCDSETNDTSMSIGVDLNRNFGFHWGGVGASSNPCDITFAGSMAFSEPESIAIANHVMKLKQEGNLLYYFSMHSYSQMILVPYSHVGGADVVQVPNYADMFEMAIKGADKLKERHNTSYTVGTSLDILYPVTGSGFDWVKGVGEVPLVFLYELRDKGPYGFLLPRDQIIPNCEEVMDSLIEMDRVARQMGYYSDGCAVKISAMLLFIALLFSLRV